MALHMYAYFKLSKKDQNTGLYRPLTVDDVDDLPQAGAFNFTIGENDVPFDFYGTETRVFDDETFGCCLGDNEWVGGGLVDNYDEDYEEMGLSRKKLTAKFLSSASAINEFFMGFADIEGDECDIGEAEDNTSGESLFRVELQKISFTSNGKKEYVVDQKVLDAFNGKITE